MWLAFSIGGFSGRGAFVKMSLYISVNFAGL